MALPTNHSTSSPSVEFPSVGRGLRARRGSARATGEPNQDVFELIELLTVPAFIQSQV